MALCSQHLINPTDHSEFNILSILENHFKNIFPFHFHEVYIPTVVDVVHLECPGEFLLRTAVTGNVDGQHELSTSRKLVVKEEDGNLI